MEPRLLEAETWQLQTLANGKAKGSEWTVLVGPHRDSMTWVGNSWKIRFNSLYMKHLWMCQESEETESLRCTRCEVLLLVRSQSREGRWVTCAQHFVKCSSGWGALSGQNLDQLIKSLSWENIVSKLPVNSPKCFSITSYRTYNCYGYLKSRRSKKMVIMVEQKMWGEASKSWPKKKKKKRDTLEWSARKPSYRIYMTVSFKMLTHLNSWKSFPVNN